MEKLGSELETQFQSFLTDTKIGNETLQQKMDSALSTLKQVSDRTTKLAMNKGLTPSEKNARKAVAMLMRRIDVAKAAEPNAIKTIDAKEIQQSAQKLQQQAQQALDQAQQKINANVPQKLKSELTTPVFPKQRATTPKNPPQG